MPSSKVSDVAAWEILYRYGYVNLNDNFVLGGTYSEHTIGVNWYWNANIKFQANYIKAYSDKGNLSLDPTIFELRAQIYF